MKQFLKLKKGQHKNISNARPFVVIGVDVAFLKMNYLLKRKTGK
jgi:hypothetical protein